MYSSGIIINKPCITQMLLFYSLQLLMQLFAWRRQSRDMQRLSRVRRTKRLLAKLNCAKTVYQAMLLRNKYNLF